MRQTRTTRRFTYRRARFGDRVPPGDTLQGMLEDACRNRPLASRRNFERSAGGSFVVNRTCGRHNDDDSDAFCAEVIAYTTGGAALIAATGQLAHPHVSVDTQDAVEGNDFVDGQAFILARDNDAVLVAGGALREPSIAYCANLLLKSDLGYDPRLNLSRVLSFSAAEQIQKHGVREISLDTTLYAETIDVIDHRGGGSVISAVSSVVKNLIGKELSEEKVKHLENLSLDVTLKFEGRAAKISKDALGIFGQHLVDDEEADYMMMLGNGATLGKNEISYSRPMSVKMDRGQVDIADAWGKMKTYLDQLGAARSV